MECESDKARPGTPRNAACWDACPPLRATYEFRLICYRVILNSAFCVASELPPIHTV
jgi:hypothetical protein